MIHDFKNPLPGRRMGAPIPATKVALETLQYLGYKIVVFCYWAGTEQGVKTITDFMDYYQLPYDHITNIKPNALAYIDDKAVQFRGWNKLYLAGKPIL